MSDAYSGIKDWSLDRDAAIRKTIGYIESSPDDAARALELEQATGVNSSAIAGDLEGFEYRAKTQMAGDLVRNNNYIADYINSHPLAPQLSSDDYGNLDTVSQKLDSLSVPYLSGPSKLGHKLLTEFGTGFLEGYGDQSHGSWAYQPEKIDYTNPVNRVGWAAWSLLGIAPEVGLRFLSGLLKGSTAAVAGAGEVGYQQLGGSESGGKSFGRALGGIGEMMTSAPHHFLPEIPPESIIKARDAMLKSEIYIKEGKEPPLGITKELDEAKIEASESEVNDLIDAIKESQASLTKERNPDMYAGFVRQQVGDQTVGVHVDVLRTLYGDKLPTHDDGILGFVPNLADKIITAEATGGYVDILMSEYIAKVDSQVAKELEDFTRVRAAGVSKGEAKDIKASIDVWHGSPHEFEAFSMEKIGTGEGAQSYGHGLYYGEARGTGESYTGNFRNRGRYIVNGKEVSTQGVGSWDNVATPELAAAYAMEQAGDNVKDATMILAGQITHNPSLKDFNSKAASLLENTKPVSKGNLYRVRINADKEQFLDWDKPFSKQSPKVQEAIRKLVETDPLLKDRIERLGDVFDEGEGLHGEDIYSHLVHTKGNVEPGSAAAGIGLGKEAASQALREAGIPGIKYLDQGSRVDPGMIERAKQAAAHFEAVIRGEKNEKYIPGKTEEALKMWQNRVKELEAVPKTHNFVLFDDSLVEITHKNDQPLPPKYAHETVRDAARLDKRERKLTLKRVEGTNEFYDEERGEVVPLISSIHAFEMVDSQGSRVGTVSIIESNNGKTLYVEDIEGLHRDTAANTIGPRALRDLFQQLKAEFPNAEELTGYRVSGARDKAGSWETKGKVSIKLAEPTASDHLFQILLDDRIERLGEEVPVGEGFTATTIPESRWQNFERGIVKVVDEEIAKLGIEDVDVEAAHKIENAKGEVVRGLYQSYENARPTILFALTADDPVGVLRHEVMHDLRTRGFLSEEEWATLEKAAIDGDWLKAHETKERYGELGDNQEALLEEAIADQFADWRRGGKPADGVFAKVFQKIDQFIEAIRAFLRQTFGTENWKDIFDRIESGEVAAREPGTEFGDVTKQAKPTQPELPGTRRMEDRDVFAEAAAAGMTKDQYLRYMKLIAERHREDLKKEAERSLKDAKKRQTDEWKANYATMREQVVEQINERPDIAADNLLREQRLYGRKTDPVHIGSDYLTPEQKASLPKDYISKDGVHPDDVAALTGYASGAELVQGLTNLAADRKASGMRLIDYNRRLIAAETERQMEAKYGSLSENILEDAKEQVLSETQLDLLHEEVLAAGLKAGTEYPITKAQMKSWVQERFDGMEAKDVSSDKSLADAGRAGRMAEDALLKGDPAEAFRQKQRQYQAVAMARLAKDFEKLQGQFEVQAERAIRKEPKGYDKDFINFAQGMLARSGYNIKRNLNELADSLQRSGYTSFDEFVQSKIGDGWELAVGEEFRQGSGKPIEKMTTAEFVDLKESLDSMMHVGRAVGKIDIAGTAEDFAEWKQGVLENIRSLPVRDKDKPVKQRFRFDASMTRMEEIAKDLDLREELGPLWNALIRPMAESKHTEYSMLEALSKKFTEMKGDKAWQRSLKDTINQNFFTDPYDATLFDLTRQDMIQIMLNFGNRSNIDKFTRGYVGKDAAPMFELQLWDMIHRNATKEDWQWVQGIWDIFDGWKKQTGKLYYDLSGRQPKWIDAAPITTPHGEFAGGYYPIIYDRLRSNINAIEEKVAPNALFGPNYNRATTANSYTKERTGYADRIQFQTSIEQVAGRMQQVIHDISYRRAVIEASKVIYDREIRGEIRKHYGMEYEKQLDPWLKDIANHFNNDEVANDFASAVMRRARSNLVGHALGLNLKVILSPSVAKMNPADAMRVWGDYAASEKLAYEKSFEIPHTFRNIDRDFRERLEASIAKGGWNEYQAAAVRWAFMPVVKVEQQFRVITFVNEYQKALAKGMSEGDASVLADSYVRERHGSTGLPDMPAVMRSSEGMKIATMFYGYFSAMYNWQRQIPGNIRRAEWNKGMENIWGAVVVPAIFGAVLFNQSKESDSWGKQMAKALVLQPLSTLVFIRDFANFFIEGNPSRTPLATAAASVSSIISDTKNYSEGKRVKKPIQHIGNVVGLSTGLPMAQLSRTTQFAVDVNKGEQRPRNIAEWARGIITGEARLKK